MDKAYPSKVDWWLGLILAVAFVAMVGAGIGVLIGLPPDASQARWVALVGRQTLLRLRKRNGRHGTRLPAP